MKIIKRLKSFFGEDDNRAVANRTLYLRRVRPSWIKGPDTLKFHSNIVKTSKYTLLTFIPKNLFGQFKRKANMYFLFIAALQLIIDSPVPAWTSTLPLLVVLTVTAAKQGYEDYRRHVADKKVNNSPTHQLTPTGLKKVMSSSIEVGDIIRVNEGEEFPCDLVLLISSDSEKTCYVNTVNLDGETNLKKHKTVSGLDLQSERELHLLTGIITCMGPNHNLYSFKGRMNSYVGPAICDQEPEQRLTFLTTDNLLLRGSKLANTNHVYGCVIYTGPDTKMALNLKLNTYKFSTVEKSMNLYLFVYFGVLVIEVLICFLLRLFLYDNKLISSWWYLGPTVGKIDLTEGAEIATSFLVLFNYIIPISLYVTLEGQKFLGSKFFVWDKLLRDEATGGEAAVCNTSDLNEEMGQIQYLFSDKTGTLTQNRMRLRYISCGGNKYHLKKGKLWLCVDELSKRTEVNKCPPEVINLLVCLSLCHTVHVGKRSAVVEREVLARRDSRRYRNKLRRSFRVASRVKTSNEPTYRAVVSPRSTDRIEENFAASESEDDDESGMFTYQATSPDEKCLVEFCQRLGVVFRGVTSGTATVSVFEELQTWTILHTLEFDTSRRRMSVVCKAPDDSYWLFCKGADSAVLPNCIHSQFNTDTALHINNFAANGHRTLAVGRKQLSDEEYAALNLKLIDIQNMIENREEMLQTLYEEVETDLELLGATGVEDKLQEDVDVTLECLRMAGVKIFVITGDKIETAVNISFSCGHFKKYMIPLDLTGADSKENAEDMLRAVYERCCAKGLPDNRFRLTMDGQTVTYLLQERSADTQRVMHRCDAVLCCRMAPAQKARIVKLVKNLPSCPVTAAIGDGANDVSMIQEAHVGFGIMGSEGRQAVRCSDFGFSQFRFLKRALLVHGHWYYDRATYLVNYSFYKNVVFITPQVYYAFFNAMSTQTLYDGFVLTCFNITMTALPILVYGLMEQSIKERTLLRFPSLYRLQIPNQNLTWIAFTKWALLGVWQSIILFFLLYYIVTYDTSSPETQLNDLYLVSTTLATAAVTVVNLKLLLETRYHNCIVFAAMVLTFIGYFIFMFLYCSFASDEIGINSYGAYWTIYVMFTSPTLMLYILLASVACLLPDICIKVEHIETNELKSVLLNQSYRSWILNLWDRMRSRSGSATITSTTDLLNNNL